MCKERIMDPGSRVHHRGKQTRDLINQETPHISVTMLEFKAAGMGTQ